MTDNRASQSYSRIVSRLQDLRAHYRKTDQIFGLLCVLGAALGWLLLALLVEALFRLPSTGRLILWGCGAILMAAIFFRHVVRPLLRTPSLPELAIRLERRFPVFRDRLIGALQLWGKHESNPEGYSLEMIDAATTDVEKEALPYDFREIVDAKRYRKAGRGVAGLMLAGLLLLFIFPGTFQSSLLRVGHPFTTYARPQKTFLVVSPGDIETVSDEDVVISAEVRGELPGQVVLSLAEAGQDNPKRYELAMEKDRVYTHTVEKVQRSFTYTVEAGDARSPVHSVTVLERPIVKQFQLRYIYPAYTHLGARDEEENIGDVRAISGTDVEIQLKTSKMLASAQVVMNEGMSIEAAVSGKEARASFTVRHDGTYHILIQDQSGLTNKDPIEYRITMLSDEYPLVRILQPGKDSELAEDMAVPLVVDAVDDFGFSRLGLVYRLGDEGEPQSLSIPLPPAAGPEMTVQHVWDLSGMDLLPEDVIFYYAEVYDNDAVSGPKSSKSRTYMIRFPSMYEIYAEVEESQEEQMVDLKEMLKESRDLKEKLDQVVRELQRESELDWEKKKETEGAIERQQEMAEDLKKLSEEMDETIEKMERNDLVSAETMEKLEEIQKLMKEIATPELNEALERLRNALQQLDRQELQQAMKDFSFNQEDFQKRLERTIELLKRLQMEQKMDALTKKMDELLERQEELNESTENADKMDEMNELSSQQENERRDLDRLKEELKELSEMMEEMPLMPSDMLDSLSQAMEESQLSEMMSQASQMLSQNQRMQAQNMQKKISQAMKKMSEGMRQAQAMMMQNMFQEVLEAMQKATRQLIELSHEQERLSTETEGLRSNSPQCEGLAEKQMDAFQNAVKVADALFEAAAKNVLLPSGITQNMGKAMNNMEEAINSLEQKNTGSASGSQREAMSDLNTTILQMRESMQSMCSSGQCSGGMQQFMQRLQQMSQMQMGLNQRTSEMGGMGQWSMEQRAELQRLAMEQEMLRKSLEELQQEMGKRPEVLGRFDQVLEDMKKVSEDMGGERLSQDTIARQNRILSRLLDYNMSMRERDYSRQRRAKPGMDVVRSNPTHLPADLGEREDLLRQDLLKALQEDYPKEYKDLIRAYFEALARDQAGTKAD